MAASDRAGDGHAGGHADGHEGGHEGGHTDGVEAQREECFTLLARLLGLLGGQAVLRRSFQREIFIDTLLVRNHVIIVMIRWTGLEPWEFDFFFQGSLTSTFNPLILEP